MTTPSDLARVNAFHGHSTPVGLGGDLVAVWGNRALFFVVAEHEPTLVLQGGDPSPMHRLADHLPYWYRVEPIDCGALYVYRYSIGDQHGPLHDFAGYSKESYELRGSQPGELSDPRTITSRIYPGAMTEYWLYINHGIDETRGAPLMVWHDGANCLEPADSFGYRMKIVSDNLVHRGLIPPMVHLLVTPSTRGEGSPIGPGHRYAATMRGIQYDTFSSRYGGHLLDELLPDAQQVIKLRTDAYSCGSAGASSGAVCAFKLGWFHSNRFSRVHSSIGSFTDIQRHPSESAGAIARAVRTEGKRNLRVWLSDGMNDLELDGRLGEEVFQAGSWPLRNIELANALKGRGYDFCFRYGEGCHGLGQAALDLPESLAWLWRGYDPDVTTQTFEQEPSEQALPMFRVRIANRNAEGSLPDVT